MMLRVLFAVVVLAALSVNAMLHSNIHQRPSSALRNYDASRGTTFQKMGFPGAMNCSAHWFDQYVDHFNFGSPNAAPSMTYKQKVLTYDNYYKPGGPIFFYAGNEGPISIFADIAGLMWQHAEEFGAALVFAEHRYYGESQPCGTDMTNTSCLKYLSSMQAMADYAILLTNWTDKDTGRYKESTGRVISFGGSYGGMLSAWMRQKYPNIIIGSVASSAPVTMVSSAYDRSSWWKPPTYDSTQHGGSSPSCARNVYDGLRVAQELVKTSEGRKTIEKVWKTCSPLSADDAHYLVGMWVQSAFGAMAMGDYPVSLNFIFGSYDHPAPAWPVRVACSHLNETSYASNETLLEKLNDAMAVINNVTLNVPCNELNQDYTDSGVWDYQVCTEEVPDSQPYFPSKGWPHDMFYDQKPYTKEMMDDHCFTKYGVTTRWGFLNTSLGGGNVRGASNIVYANGLYDPWHTGGILWNVSETVRSYIIPDGGHHLDLLFATDAEPAVAKWVRKMEMEHVRRWLAGKP